MQALSAVFDGFVIAGIYLAVKKYIAKNGERPWVQILAAFLLILYSTFRTVAIYRVQENSNFFFWHPYLTWLIVDLFDFAFLKHSVKEKLLLWPLIIIPVISGFELAVGWLIKLYIWKI